MLIKIFADKKTNPKCFPRLFPAFSFFLLAFSKPSSNFPTYPVFQTSRKSSNPRLQNNMIIFSYSSEKFFYLKSTTFGAKSAGKYTADIRGLWWTAAPVRVGLELAAASQHFHDTLPSPERLSSRLRPLYQPHVACLRLKPMLPGTQSPVTQLVWIDTGSLSRITITVNSLHGQLVTGISRKSESDYWCVNS